MRIIWWSDVGATGAIIERMRWEMQYYLASVIGYFGAENFTRGIL